MLRKWLLAIMCCLCLASVGTGAFLITDYVQEQSKTESTEDPTVHTESNRYICVNQRMRYSYSGVTNQYNGQAQQGSYSYSKTDSAPFMIYWCDENGNSADWGTSPTANGNSVSGSNTSSGWCGSLTYTYNGYEVRRMAKVKISVDSGYAYYGYSTSATWNNSTYQTPSTATILWLYGTGNVSTSQPSNSASVVTATTNVTVYIFLRKTTSVSFNQSGGSGGQTSNITFVAGRTYYAIKSSVSVPTKTGYTFNGYYTAQWSGGTKAFDASGIGVSNYYDASVSTLYAQWTAKRYAVTLVPTDATGGATSNQTFYAEYNSGSQYASSTGSTMASITTPTRIGFIFVGWYTEANGGTQVLSTSHDYMSQGASGYVQTGSAIWIRDGTATFYAHWGARSISIKYDANGGTMGNGSATQTNATQNGKYSSSVTATRNGYTNSGWSINLVSTVTTQYGGNQYLEQAGYSLDRGIITTSPIKTTTGHYYVLGVVPNSGVTVSERGFYLYSGSGYSASTDKVVTGKLQATSSYTHIIPYAVTSSTNPTASTLDAFVVREMDSDGALIKTSLTGTLLYDGTHTVLANWVGATYSLVYNMNGTGALAPSNTSFIYNATVTTSTPTAPGLTFEGWYTVGNGALGTSGSKITSNKTQMNAGLSSANFNHSNKTLTVYAKWSRNVYTITLAKNNGSGGTSTIYEKYGDGYYLDSSCSQKMTTSANAITKPSRPGYSFNGYNIGSATFIDSNGYLTSRATNSLASDYTFTAQWAANTITITLNNQDATSAGTTKVYYKYATATYYSNSACTSSYAITSITKPTRTNYTFGGYFTSTGGSGTQYINSSGGFTNNLYSAVSENKTLYAGWQYTAQSVKVHVMTASATSTTFSESKTGMTSGNVVGVVVSGPYSTSSGSHALSTTSAVTTFDWWVGHTMATSGTPASGYVYAGISTSSSLTMSSSPATSVTITSSVSDVYIFFKQTAVPLYYSTARGGYWYYEDGYFPQTYVSNPSLISALNNISNWLDFRIGSGQTVRIYRYNDQFYAKVTAPRTQTIKLNSGSNVSFTSGSNYWFKCEPIRWRITPYGTSSTKYSVGQTLTNVYGISDMLGYGIMNALSGNGVTAGKNSLDMSGAKVANTMSFAQFSSYGLGSFDLEYSIYGSDSSVGNTSIDDKSVSQSGTTMYVANAAKGIGNNIGANAASPSTYAQDTGNHDCAFNDMFYSSDLSAFLAGQNFNNGRGWVNDLYNLGSGYTLSADGTMITTFLDQMYGYIFCHLVTYSTGNGSKT